MQQLIQTLTQQLEAVEVELETALASDPTWAASAQRLQTIPGIGHTGNARLRTVLYLATLSAAHHNPVIAAFYQRLRSSGKPMQVARCAAARKLVHLASAVVTRKQDFDPHEQPLHPPAKAG